MIENVTLQSATPFLYAPANSSELPVQNSSAHTLKSFEEAFRETGCMLNTTISPTGSAPAAYLPFIYYPEKGGPTYLNEILVNLYLKTSDGNLIARTPEQITISERHEKVHALQWHKVPALHASPYNQATPIVLSPESWVLMTILTEREAFAKTAWLNALELEVAPSERFRNQAKTETLTPDDIDLKSQDIRMALQKASLAWDNRLKHKSKDTDPDMTLLDHYIQNALDVYEQSNRLNIEKSPVPPIFVRLSPEDILAIGSTFGPSTFGDGTPDDIFTSLPPMSSALYQKLEALNRKHGIEQESDLPTVNEALQTLGLTAETYMVHSKFFKHTAEKGEKPTQNEQSYEIENRSADNTPAPGM
ncbi:MAG: hypothetical protein LRY36_00935 [Alphaproteobacteria bacterium]|nr:hypothetical protein [Alphaproteobacteria bacterium]